MSRVLSLHRLVRDNEASVTPLRALVKARSRFECLAEASPHLSPDRAKMLGLLLAAADPRACGGHAVLRPLWANEAMHRAWSLVQLILRLDQRDEECDPFCASLDLRTAEELARSYASLGIKVDAAMQPCSQVLREIVVNLVDLFAPDACRIRLRTAIDSVTLPEFKRRALVLLASELVTNALMHGFQGRSNGEITVVLETVTGEYARLVVVDNGNGAGERGLQNPQAIAYDLAGLLESDLIRCGGLDGGTRAQIVFACRA